MGYLYTYGRSLLPISETPVVSNPPIAVSEKIEFKKFSSETEYKDYIKSSDFSGLYNMNLSAPRSFETSIDTGSEVALSPQDSTWGGLGLESSEATGRVSETNVQVAGIDEPDIVKTDGEELYYSPSGGIYRSVQEPMLFEVSGVLPPEYEKPKTKALKVLPPEDIALDSEIDANGNLLLVGDMLLVFENQKVYGYDVKDPKNPEEKWTFDLDEKQQIVTSRLYNGKVYLVARTQLNSRSPCPVPLSTGGMSIPCTDVYHPVGINFPADSTYTAMILDPSNGEVKDKISFVGSNSNVILYMSPDAMYVTYSHYPDMVEFMYRFFKEKGSDIIPADVINQLGELVEMDISQEAKLVEFGKILEEYMQSASSDEQLKLENDFENRLKDFVKENARELEKTSIVKIGVKDLDILTTGTIPGTPLNQFSLDEYEGNLRVATTISGGIFGTGDSANDVYVLNENLDYLGSVKDLGLTERIYSARFIEDKGYVVTFRQIDPFYVIDMSDPSNPTMAGELKIPGYSAYLHPINKDKIIGVGEEDRKVKISLFDVSNPDNPTEVSKYSLDEYYTEVESNHHAFLMDAEHKVFFLPGSKGGYIFSYDNDQLTLKMAVADINAQRAIYINDYMYIVGSDKIKVIDENKWEKIKEFEL